MVLQFKYCQQWIKYSPFIDGVILLYHLLEFRKAEFSRSIWLEANDQLSNQIAVAASTFVVKFVNPAEFSLVCLPLCGPAFGFWPFLKASRIFFVVAGVKSSWNYFENVPSPTRGMNLHRSHHQQPSWEHYYKLPDILPQWSWIYHLWRFGQAWYHRAVHMQHWGFPSIHEACRESSCKLEQSSLQ